MCVVTSIPSYTNFFKLSLQAFIQTPNNQPVSSKITYTVGSVFMSYNGLNAAQHLCLLLHHWIHA